MHTIKIVGKDPALRTLMANVDIVAPTNAHVLVSGETGTGKELVASAIHKLSLRADRPMVTLNCAALVESLIESELFGYMKGAFTGASADKHGIIAAADGGTLFLDEINSLSLTIQAKLLRFLENGEYVPVGATKTRKADVRVISASNVNLSELVAAGKFREDLFFRLNVVPLVLPPLRERRQDIDRLLKHYFAYFAKKYRVKTPTLTESALAVLLEYPWPGNIRELRNLCENLTIRKTREAIRLEELPRAIFDRPAEKPANSNAFVLPNKGVNWGDLEKRLITDAMEKSGGKYQQAAALLGITRDALYYRVKKYQLTGVGGKKVGAEAGCLGLLRQH